MPFKPAIIKLQLRLPAALLLTLNRSSIKQPFKMAGLNFIFINWLFIMAGLNTTHNCREVLYALHFKADVVETFFGENID